ncbi:MAG: c-type cytochrome [Flavobacteriaceae bacterium]
MQYLFKFRNAAKSALIGGLGLLLPNCEEEPSPPLSPTQALESFVLAEDNVEIQLVASEPMIQDPVAISFDEAGRLWVVEMLGFMTDIDGSGEQDPVGRVSVLFDDDQDGAMDRSTVFLDSLILPRALAVVEGGVLVSENIPLWFAKDTDGDFKADEKILVDSTYGGSGMPEHSANGLWRGIDNWIYNAKSKFRYQYQAGKWVKEETEFRGQWGIVHDNLGRLFYNYNWSQLHADLVPPNALLANKHHIPTSGIDHGLTLERAIYPIRSNTAVNRGYVPGTLDEQGRLLEFASACGPLIHRGDGLPAMYSGDAFVCEPTANLIKRNKIIEEGFMLSAKGVYDQKEFLASTDERFRPISLASGPDGAIYIVDMYKGIIQHGPYMTPYLREETLKRKLDRPIHMGRIWRISSKTPNHDRQTDLSKADARALLKLLGHENGWTRDMAQRLLIEQGLSIYEDLLKVVHEGNPLARLHALWTLDGLGWKEAASLLPSVNTMDPKAASTVLQLIGRTDTSQADIQSQLSQFAEQNYEQAHPLVQMQLVLLTNKMTSNTAFEISRKFLARFGQLAVARDVVMASLENREAAMLTHLVSQKGWTSYNQNREIFIEMLATAITNKGSQNELKFLIDKLDATLPSEELWLKTAIANGMINAKGGDKNGEIVLAKAPDFLSDEEPFFSLSQKLSWPGKIEVPQEDKGGKFEVDSELFALGRQKYLNLCANCHGTDGAGMKRFAPPLKNSEWVEGEAYKLAMILLHGMEGPVTVDGKLYDTPDILPSMPAFTTLQNNDIAAIATYIRNSWGNAGSPISSGVVGGIRFRTQGKITPWKASELDTVQYDPNQ